MNGESSASKRLPDVVDRNRTCVGGRRAWEREVREFCDDDLVACVRAQASVERAVNCYRRPRSADRITFEVPA